MVNQQQDERLRLLRQWLKHSDRLTEPTLHPLTGDASFRRYFRIPQSGNKSYIAMDAPPDKENCAPFVAISRALRAHGLMTPDIILENMSEGFLLLTDFGDQLLLNTLHSSNADFFYKKALNTLALLQSCPTITDWKIPPFSADFMYNELKLFQQWYLKNYLALPLSESIEKILDQLFIFLAQTAANQPTVFMHRDYHSANLMVLADDQIGVLDFQDAFIGPVTYDLVSLLRDCYIAWPEDQVTPWALHYRDQLKLPISDSAFLRWFDLMGLQRHLKALLTFSRKYRRDGNASYLKHIPRTLNYIMIESERYPECQAFHTFLHETILPAQKEVMTACVE